MRQSIREEVPGMVMLAHADMIEAGGDGAAAPSARAGPEAPTLAPREKETLRYIAGGYTHAQAARRMGISEATVDTYVKRIRQKFNLGNKAELTRLAIQVAWSDAGTADLL
jgi:DNA-binding CsgD family transcriptional regulator